MSRHCRIALALVLAWLAPRTSPAQVVNQQVIVNSDGGPLQMMPPGREPKTGTGILRGRIVAADSGQPIRRAQVRISGSDIGTKSALTDGNGRYEFKELPAGRFNVSVTKGGFVSMQYGQNRPFEPGRPIELAEGQVMDKVDVGLPRGSVIAGRVLDEFGEPVIDAMVTAMRMQFANGRRRLVNAGRMSQTNDLGQFRLYGLPPGDYYVSATYRGAEMFVDVLSPQGGPSGSSPNSGYAPTYYPNSPNPGEAQRVTVAAGQELNGIDVSLQPVKLARIAGVVVGADGRPVSSAMVMLMPAARDAMLFMPGGTTRTNKDGQFTLQNVAPGDYSLQARTMGPMMFDGGGGAMVFSMTTRTDGGSDTPKNTEPEFASVPVSVTGDDMNGLVVVTSHGAAASGRVVFDGGVKPDGIDRIRVMAPSADPDGGPTVGAGPGVVKADGTFTMSGLAGTRLLRAGPLPKGWVLKSVRVNGVDATDTGVEFKPGEDVGGIEIDLTQQSTLITGTVTDDHGQPLKEYTVVVFATDESKWALPMTRWTSAARPDQEGHFRLQNLPPGDYYAIAVDYVAAGDWGDPDWLARARNSATTFTLDAGNTKALDLKLSGM